MLQLEVWGYSDGDVIPRRVFIVAQRIGGQVLGAFDGDTIVGFAMSLPGYRDGACLSALAHAGCACRSTATPASAAVSSSPSATMPSRGASI